MKDSKDELILIFSGTLLQILGTIYETFSVPYLDRSCLRCFYGKRYSENWGTFHSKSFKFLYIFLSFIEKELPFIRRPSNDNLKSEYTILKALPCKRLVLLLMVRERNIQIRGQ